MKKKLKKYQVGVDSETFAISLVESPAIEEEFVALSEQTPIEIQMADEERHILYGAALIPNKPIYRNNGETEFYIEFSKESIEKMSYEFLKEYRQHSMTLDHSTDADEVYVVESWLVEDSYKDKSNALGMQLPVGSWCVGTKVNNIEVWERVKKGELNGFSIEASIVMEEFSKQEDNNLNKELYMDEMNLFKKFKEMLNEYFQKEPLQTELSGLTEEQLNEEVESIMTELEETTVDTTVETTVEEPTVEETVSEPLKEEEPTVDTVTEEKPADEPVNDQNEHLNELVKNLQSEIEALKEYNKNLQTKIEDMGKQPSTKPITVNGNGNGNTYTQWRERMKAML